jgi:ATP-dependent helicase HepA
LDTFLPGQRWISHAEIQLGLGKIVASDHRTVTIDFPASDETRTYARDNAPLTRIIYKSGETIKTQHGASLIIEKAVEEFGLYLYHCQSEAKEAVILPESELAHQIQLQGPADKLFSGQIDKNRDYELRYHTQSHRHRLSQLDISGLAGCRTSLLPHQLYIAHEVANRYAPRVLLADEVGLGKTIEAGLIIHHQLLNERVQRVLIIVPESLVHQWLVEMLRRFNLLFNIFDKQRCQASPDENPFEQEQLILCSLEFLQQHEDYYQQCLDSGWDLLVVDEAHHLQWSPENSSKDYELIETMARQTPAVLLLTATPEQLGKESHFARLRLLDADRFPDLNTFLAEEHSYQSIARAIDQLLNRKMLDQEARDILTATLKEEGQTSQTPDFSDTESIINHMLDRHGTGRVLFRNTRAAVQGFPERQVFSYPLSCPVQYKQVLDSFLQSLQAKEAPFSRLILYPELMYQIMNAETSPETSGNYWYTLDPRVDWLGSWLKQQRHKKTLVIAANADTVIELANVMKMQWGIHCALFHEKMSLLERDRAAAFFADSEQGSPVLICSEIGSEGRNFQFAHQLILFDLPINPDVLEQRIGRLDRIGQTQTISIHVPIINDTAQNLLFHWYHEGLNAFRQTCPVGHNVYEKVQKNLETVLIQGSPLSSQAVADLLEKTKSLALDLNQALHEGRDKLLELNSCRQPYANQLKQQCRQADIQSELEHYMTLLFDALGIEQSEHSEYSYVLTPGEQMLSQFPGLPDDGMTITYNREIALANEDRQFFTWEHPMVLTAMDMVTSSELGNTSMIVINQEQLAQSLKPGSLLVETLFMIETTAHDQLQANRYLPPTPLRCLLNEQALELTESLSFSMIDKALIETRLPVDTAREIIRLKETIINSLIKQSIKVAEQQTPELVQAARQKSQHLLLSEIQRLNALAQVNPNIRQEEIDFYRTQLQSLEKIYAAIQPRLDALRVIIVT